MKTTVSTSLSESRMRENRLSGSMSGVRKRMRSAPHLDSTKRGGSDADCWQARFSGCVRGGVAGSGHNSPFPAQLSVCGGVENRECFTA